ncbi:MAG: single-stranded DNA-binding protein [Candidatus Saganbacteria bacterium]|nr:single-stranded DNA-binding protein [Candidatus Saganbacteria bacterium]
MQLRDTLDEIKQLLAVLPPRVYGFIQEFSDVAKLVEIVLDLGKLPEIRFDGQVVYIEGPLVTQEDLDYVTSQVGDFSLDNRAGIERTLHRISAIRNRRGKVIGLTCRVGRAIYGTIDIIRDVVESGKNILFLGPPGIGKTTKLRESSRVLSDEFHKRVIIVDTSNEIAGDGDIPHPGIGRARRMQVSTPDKQHAVMIEAVENHMPEVIVVDEIGTEEEAKAARTIAERGVQLIGTAHGNNLDNLLNNPTLSDLVGGIQTVILGDDEARRRHTQKSVLERKAPPTFDMLIEILERDTFAIFFDVARAVDLMLKGKVPRPEIRIRKEDGKIEIRDKTEELEEIPDPTEEEAEEIRYEKEGDKVTRIYPFAVNKGQIERAIASLGIPAIVVDSLNEADIVLTIKSRAKPSSRMVKGAAEAGIPVHVIRKNVSSQILRFLKYNFGVGSTQDPEELAAHEAQETIRRVGQTGRSEDLSPQNAYLRRLQHQMVDDAGMRSESVGEEPTRRLRIYPRA